MVLVRFGAGLVFLATGVYLYWGSVPSHPIAAFVCGAVGTLCWGVLELFGDVANID